MLAIFLLRRDKALINLFALPDLQIRCQSGTDFGVELSVFDRQGEKKSGINLATLYVERT